MEKARGGGGSKLPDPDQLGLNKNLHLLYCMNPTPGLYWNKDKEDALVPAQICHYRTHCHASNIINIYKTPQ